MVIEDGLITGYGIVFCVILAVMGLYFVYCKYFILCCYRGWSVEMFVILVVVFFFDRIVFNMVFIGIVWFYYFYYIFLWVFSLGCNFLIDILVFYLKSSNMSNMGNFVFFYKVCSLGKFVKGGDNVLIYFLVFCLDILYYFFIFRYKLLFF